MPTRTTPECDASMAWFWEQYIEIIQNQGTKKHFSRCYVSRAQGYIDARPGLRL